ncbi:MAG: SpoVA/SpoVAEb family sporulation membrane protein [Lachnospiraceae bacterium]
MELNKQEYSEYVKQITPTHSLPMSMLRAFIVGGIICTFGQLMINGMMSLWEIEKEAAAAWTQLELILLSVVLTGFNIYPKIVKWGGAGALVPITGFANSVVAPAIEYKSEGHVFGIGCKIFTIAGPVILFGLFTSWILGLIHYLTGIGSGFF